MKYITPFERHLQKDNSYDFVIFTSQKLVNTPDCELNEDFELPIKECLLKEKRQLELLNEINENLNTNAIFEFLENEVKVIKAHKLAFNTDERDLQERFFSIIESIVSPRDALLYCYTIIRNLNNQIIETYGNKRFENADEFLDEFSKKDFFKALKEITKEKEALVEALNQIRDTEI